MIGPGFAAAAFARDITLIIAIVIGFAIFAVAGGVGAFYLLTAIFGSVT